MPSGLAQLVALLCALSLSSAAFYLTARYRPSLRPTPTATPTAISTAAAEPGRTLRLPRTSTPLQRLQAMLAAARIPLHPLLFLLLSLWSGLIGARLVAVLANPPLSLSVFLTTALLPLVAVRSRIMAVRLRVMKALGPALVQLTKVADVRQHPFLALQDTIGAMDEPLKSEFTQALREYEAGAALHDALRLAATHLCGNPYLYQLAELVELSLHAGCNFSEALFRLLARYRQTEELQAEERTQMKGYTWLTWVFYLGSLLPLAYWLLHDPGSVAAYQTPLAKVLVLWVYWSGLAIVVLPRLFAVEEV